MLRYTKNKLKSIKNLWIITCEKQMVTFMAKDRIQAYCYSQMVFDNKLKTVWKWPVKVALKAYFTVG
jgi:hypothetical protein